MSWVLCLTTHESMGEAGDITIVTLDAARRTRDIVQGIVPRSLCLQDRSDATLDASTGDCLYNGAQKYALNRRRAACFDTNVKNWSRLSSGKRPQSTSAAFRFILSHIIPFCHFEGPRNLAPNMKISQSPPLTSCRPRSLQMTRVGLSWLLSRFLRRLAYSMRRTSFRHKFRELAFGA